MKSYCVIWICFLLREGLSLKILRTISRADRGWSEGIMCPASKIMYKERLSYCLKNPVVCLCPPFAYKTCGFAAVKLANPSHFNFGSQALSPNIEQIKSNWPLYIVTESPARKFDSIVSRHINRVSGRKKLKFPLVQIIWLSYCWQTKQTCK